MCGIAGVISKKEIHNAKPEEQVRRMLPYLAHRGPDAEGIWHCGMVALGHRRLKIIDLSDTANQPFSDGRDALVFNGEIFNYLELREDLIKKGHRFLTRSDTEVILRLYSEYGADCVRYMNGQWAFALWDASRRRLFLLPEVE